MSSISIHFGDLKKHTEHDNNINTDAKLVATAINEEVLSQLARAVDIMKPSGVKTLNEEIVWNAIMTAVPPAHQREVADRLVAIMNTFNVNKST